MAISMIGGEGWACAIINSSVRGDDHKTTCSETESFRGQTNSSPGPLSIPFVLRNDAVEKVKQTLKAVTKTK